MLSTFPYFAHPLRSRASACLKPTYDESCYILRSLSWCLCSRVFLFFPFSRLFFSAQCPTLRLFEQLAQLRDT